jgi:hypothetical protein
MKRMSFTEKAKNHFLDLYKKSSETAPYPAHVMSVERVAREIQNNSPDANIEILLLSVWMHDIGALLGDREIHDINSEQEARRYLSEIGLESDKIEKVAHCVRAHRCRDIQPETIEAKILAVADSASHLVDGPYVNMKIKYGKEYVLAKLERDYRDIGLLPNIKERYEPIYKAWAKLLEVLPE